MTKHDSRHDDAEQPDDVAKGAGWLLPMPGNLLATVGEAELIYVFPFEPEVFPIPNAPQHARGVIVWRKHFVPLIDLNACLRPHSSAAPPESRVPNHASEAAADSEVRVGESAIEELIALFAFQIPHQAAGTSGLGALLLSDVPERVVVSDDIACELPDELGFWNTLATSCYSHEIHGAVPIIDLAPLFTTTAVPSTDRDEKSAARSTTGPIG